MFKFEKNRSESYQALHDKGRTLKNSYSNVYIGHESLGFFGYAHHIHEDRKGLLIVEYAVDKVVRKTGPVMEAPFELIQDCEFHCYALKLNVLAYLTGKKIQEMYIRDIYNNKSIPVRQNLAFTERFLNNASKLLTTKVEEPELVTVCETEPLEQTQQKLFV